jgi:hypothetical protein
MAWYDNLLLWVIIALDLVGPTVLLLLLWRWTRRWWIAFAGTLVLVPLVAYFLTGGLAWLSTYLRVVVRGDTSVPDSIGETVTDYLIVTFDVCGAYGVMLASTGFVLSLPLVGLWRLVHPGSFKHFTRSGQADPEPSAAAESAS